jgi:heat shock protein HslJ
MLPLFRPLARRALITAAPLMLWACATPAPPLEVAGLWRIDQARTEPLLDRSRARLSFGRDGMLTGHTSCNTLRASYTLEGDKLKIGPIITTRMACAQPLMEQEDRVLSALEIAATARVRPDGLLELREADGRGVLRATRFAAGEP